MEVLPALVTRMLRRHGGRRGNPSSAPTLTVTEMPVCAFDSGILRALFSRHYGRSAAIKTRCYSMGLDHRRFETVIGDDHYEIV